MGMLGIAFAGGGKRDSELTTKEGETAMFVSEDGLYLFPGDVLTQDSGGSLCKPCSALQRSR